MTRLVTYVLAATIAAGAYKGYVQPQLELAQARIAQVVAILERGSP